MKKKFFTVILGIIIAFVSVTQLCQVDAQNREIVSEERNDSNNILDSGKEILYFAFFTKGRDASENLKEIGLNEEMIDDIKSVALEQFNEVNKIKALYKDKKSDMEIAEYNNLILSESQSVKNKIKDILNGQYDDFIKWLSEYWNVVCMNRTPISINDIDASDDADIEVYATQFDIDDYCVALPDKYLKFANLGWDDTYKNPTYTVDVISYNRGTAVYEVPVNEVGPWNEMDDYWHSNRWEFTDLELSLPEAEAAYFEDYNDGCDELGRVVSNPAGIDLSPEVASDLGFGDYESGWISIHLNF